jgi:SAM-dependent methyltransferase
MSEAWFEEWFNTEYYFLLYQHRDDAEAQRFLHLLLNMLHVPKGASILDIACGKGRHSKVLADAGMDVCGIDLSPNSIQAASENEGPHLRFAVHDMRIPFAHEQFDLAVNLFTSFGYTEREADDQAALNAAYAALKPGGLFIQDYLNAAPVLETLPQKQELTRNKVRFATSKYHDHGFIKKDILVEDGTKQFHFTEQVKIYSLEQLTAMHQHAGFTIKHIYGNQELEAYEADASPRIIIVSQKP